MTRRETKKEREIRSIIEDIRNDPKAMKQVRALLGNHKPAKKERMARRKSQ